MERMMNSGMSASLLQMPLLCACFNGVITFRACFAGRELAALPYSKGTIVHKLFICQIYNVQPYLQQAFCCAVVAGKIKTMLKERYEQMKALAFPVQTEERTIELLINRLIDSLYKPNEEYQFVRDSKRCKQFEIDEEPINWGNLKVNEVLKRGDTYDVYIEEASPNDCPSFCAYIEKYMVAWGWQVSVKTEW